MFSAKAQILEFDVSREWESELACARKKERETIVSFTIYIFLLFPNRNLTAF